MTILFGNGSEFYVREVKNNYGVFTIAQMILEAMIDLDDDEYAYYCDILQFA